MEHLQFASPLPYPSLEGILPNEQDLQRMRSNYAGLTSELSAITQYVYHQLNAKNDGFFHIGRNLLSIAQIEMRHLNLFGTTILKLGGDPRFVYPDGRDLSYWNGSLIDHCRTLPQMLQFDLELELKTIHLYHSQASATCQPPIAKMLERIIIDEEIHVQLLKSMLNEFPQLK